MTVSDRYEDVVRATYGAVQDMRDRTTLAALFDREFPHVADLDIARYARLLREERFVGRAADPTDDWCAIHAVSGWHYVHGSPHGGAVFMFRSRTEADAFATRFPARRADVDPGPLAGDRRVPGCGLHVVSLGWHRMRDIGHRPDPSADAFLAVAAIRVGPFARDGLWSLGASLHLPQREGGYYVGGEYRQLVARFTHAGDAEAFRASIKEDPVTAPDRDGWHAVELGTRDWRHRGDVEAAFRNESLWCTENGVGWNWAVDCSASGDADTNPTRILFRSPEHVSAFRDSTLARAPAS